MSEADIKLPIPRSWFNNLALKISGTVISAVILSMFAAVGTAYHFMSDTKERLSVLETEMKGLIGETNQRVDLVDRRVEAAMRKSKMHEQQIAGLQREDREIHQVMKVQGREPQEPVPSGK
jgi:hypothetical protein